MVFLLLNFALSILQSVQMKKVLTFCFFAIVAVLAILAIWRFGIRKSIPDAPVQEQVLSILKQNDCFACHSAEPAVPFYSSFPVIGPRMAEHVSHAVIFTDLEAAFYDMDAVDEVALSMLEYSIASGNMPLPEYRLIHWGTGFNAKEKKVLSAWVKDTRLARFSNGLSCAEFAAEPIFPIPDSIAVDPAKAAMGERLYNDGRLSLDGTITCATCHVLEDGGADHADERTSEGINGQKGGVNAPTVYNSYFNIRQFWNGRAADLQQQAASPPTNPVEMGYPTWDDIVAVLKKDTRLVSEFDVLYPGTGITEFTVTDAIGEYEKTLLTPDSPFDLYLKGDKNALSADEIKGYETFRKNACATCHTGVILGGQSFEHLSIYGDYFADRNPEIAYVSDDDGLKGFTGKDSDLHKFKVPGLRNVALTAPYFHDGTILTMEDAVKAMFTYQYGKSVPDEDVASIVTFLKTLTGKHPDLNPTE